MIQLYFWAATVVTFVALIKLPTKLSAVDNIGGTLVASICFGWLIWPFAIWAERKSRKGAR